VELTEYAGNLLRRDDNDRSIRRWAQEAQRMVAWHTIRLVLFHADLHDDERREYRDLLNNVLASIDPREPLIVPVAVREALLTGSDEGLTELITSRTALRDAA